VNHLGGIFFQKLTKLPSRKVSVVDIVSKEVRSRMMSAVRSKDTKVELEIRRRLFAMGFRFRLHKKNLAGTPDLYFKKYMAVIFVHGCFWHNHGCSLSQLPASRRKWWKEKLEGNNQRDNKALGELIRLGFRVLTIWECSFRRPGVVRGDALDEIAIKASRFLVSSKRCLEISSRTGDNSKRKRTKGRGQWQTQ
jgi:DNA mismatch endonuclease (patch repair protein)